MRYSILDYNQQKLVEYSLDATDVIILNWFSYFYSSSYMLKINDPVVENGKQYGWVSCQKVIDDMPILGITTTKGIANRFNKYIEKGLIEKYVENNSSGARVYFRTTEVYDTLLTCNVDKIKTIKKESTKQDNNLATPPFDEVFFNENADKSTSDTHQNETSSGTIIPTHQNETSCATGTEVPVLLNRYLAIDSDINDKFKHSLNLDKHTDTKKLEKSVSKANLRDDTNNTDLSKDKQNLSKQSFVVENPINGDTAHHIFEIFSNAGLKCCNKNYEAFLMRDFKLGIESIKDLMISKTELIQACKNYASVINLKDNTWWKANVNFYSLCKSKVILKFLPSDFDIKDFKKAESIKNKQNKYLSYKSSSFPQDRISL